MERVERESLGFFCPEPADKFIRRETFECLEALGEVVSIHEVGEMASKLIVCLVIEGKRCSDPILTRSHE
jgi:hypothetical protein